MSDIQNEINAEIPDWLYSTTILDKINELRSYRRGLEKMNDPEFINKCAIKASQDFSSLQLAYLWLAESTHFLNPYVDVLSIANLENEFQL